MNDREKGKNNIWKIGLIICLSGALISGICLGVRFYRQRYEEKQLEELAELVNVSSAESDGQEDENVPDVGKLPEAETESSQENPEAGRSLEEKRLALEEKLGIEIPEKNPDFQELQETVNADIYAWLYIPDTQIDFPIVQHPTDNSYYLKYNLDGSKGYPGGIFTENYNSRDFTDRQTVIYGHKVKGGFKALHDYEDADFFAEHPYIFIYTENDILVYQIFAACEFSNIHLILSFDLSDDTIFQNYLQGILDTRDMNSNIHRDMTFTSDSRILTLSTCVKNKANERYLVQGVLLNENS